MAAVRRLVARVRTFFGASPEQEEVEEARERWGDDINYTWGEENETQLRQKVKEHPSNRETVVLVIGQVGAGKSCFCNGVKSAMEGRDVPSHYFDVCTDNFGTVQSNTKQFITERMHNFRLVDMPGLSNTIQIAPDAIKKIILGEVSLTSKLNERLTTDEEPVARENRKPISTVILVVKATSDLSDILKQQISVLRTLARDGDTSLYMVLTHIDLADKQLRHTRNIKETFQSAKVKQAVEFASKETGIPQTRIGVVRNFTNRSNTHPDMHILYLHVVYRALRLAEEYFQRREPDTLQVY